MDDYDLKYKVYGSKLSNFFNELLEFKLTYDDKLNMDDYNMFSKVMVNYFNSGVFNEFIGGKYKLSKHDDHNHYTMHDTSNDSPMNNLYISGDTYQAIQDKYPINGIAYVEQISKFIDDIEASIYNSEDNFITKRKKYIEKMKVVDYSMNERELAFQESFFKSDIGSHYNVNFKNQTLKTLIQDKLNMDTPVQAVFCKNFADHYQLLKKTFPYEFYPEYIGSAHAFNKQCHFMHDELDLAYMPCVNDHMEYSRNVDHKWILLHQNNRYAGGVIVSNASVNEIRHISMKKSIANRDNYKKILDEILSSDSVSQSVFITAPEIQTYGLQDELRNQYKNRPLYFTEREKSAYFILESFIELNGLANQNEKIKKDFYKNIIIKHNKLINDGDLFEYSYNQNESTIDLLMDKFKIDVLQKYPKTNNEADDIDRETFIRRCFVSQHGENDYKYYLQNYYDGMDFAFRLPLDGNGTTDLLNLVKDFLVNQNIAYTQDVYKAVYDSINQSQQIATHENNNKEFLTYSYHSLYDTLSASGAIKTNKEPCYVFRLEMPDGKGVYKSDNSDDDFMKSNDATILEYDQRKIPQRDKGLSTLFLAYDCRYIISNKYSDAYQFAFESKEQMTSWFSRPELEEFSKKGAKLYRCEVAAANMISSQVQVAFNANTLISKVELDLNEFLEIEQEKKPLINRKMKM
jgi:hypothetical protein